MNYKEAMDFMHKAGKFGSVLGTDTVKELLNRLGNPQNQLKVIHVAGTNGKGSILAFLASVFRESGYEAGRYVSPASFCYEEKFRINEAMIAREELCHYIERMQKIATQMVEDGFPHPTVFEMETGISFLYFLEHQVDVVLLETGLGGRLDATNVVERPICTVIASIGFDHMQFLGNTIEEIAMEKAGIIKPGVPVVSYDNQSEAKKVIQRVSKEQGAPVVFVDTKNIRVLEENLEKQCFSYHTRNGRWYPNIQIPLLGSHQIKNAATALEVLEIAKNHYCFGDFHIEEGFQKTVWHGRLELLGKEPYIFCDGAHNIDGAKKLYEFLEKNFTNREIIYIMGVLADKDYKEMLQITGKLATKIYTVTPDSERALSAKDLAKEARNVCGDVLVGTTLRDTFSSVKQEAKKEDVIVIFGTLSFLNELQEEE